MSARCIPAQLRALTELATLVIPDERFTPPSWDRVVIVTVVTDGRYIWHCYPDGDRPRIELPTVSTPRETAVKPRSKPARRRTR